MRLEEVGSTIAARPATHGAWLHEKLNASHDSVAAGVKRPDAPDYQHNGDSAGRMTPFLDEAAETLEASIRKYQNRSIETSVLSLLSG